MAIKKPGGSVEQRKNKLIFAGIIGLVALVFVGVLMLMRGVYQTETYYILGNNVPTRTQITPEMMVPITTSKDTSPPNALSIADVQDGSYFTKYNLNEGDILTKSNAGSFDDIATGVPDTWVVTSFAVSADNAVGGRIRRGDYFDLMVATKDGSYYPFVNMLALHTSVSMNSASNAGAVDSEEAQSGQTSQYTVAGTPEDMAKLQQVVQASGSNIRLILSPRQNQYAPPQLSTYSANGDAFKFDINDGPKDLGKGTDNTFTPVKRDAFGRPAEEPQSCSQGNGKLTAEECAKAGVALNEAPTAEEATN